MSKNEIAKSSKFTDYSVPKIVASLIWTVEEKVCEDVYVREEPLYAYCAS